MNNEQQSTFMKLETPKPSTSKISEAPQIQSTSASSHQSLKCYCDGNFYPRIVEEFQSDDLGSIPLIDLTDEPIFIEIPGNLAIPSTSQQSNVIPQEISLTHTTCCTDDLESKIICQLAQELEESSLEYSSPIARTPSGDTPNTNPSVRSLTQEVIDKMEKLTQVLKRKIYLSDGAFFSTHARNSLANETKYKFIRLMKSITDLFKALKQVLIKVHELSKSLGLGTSDAENYCTNSEEDTKIEKVPPKVVTITKEANETLQINCLELFKLEEIAKILKQTTDEVDLILTPPELPETPRD